MTEITATVRQLLDQIGVCTPADLTSQQAADAHNQLLQLVNNLLKEALDETARAEKTLTGRLRDLERTLQSELNLLRQGQTPTGLPSYHARECEPERFRLAAAVEMVTMLAPLRRRLLAGPPPATTTKETTHGR
jgi:hypothetical protein